MIQGKCSLFCGNRTPRCQKLTPALPGEGASRPWVDSCPSLSFYQEMVKTALYLLASTLPALAPIDPSVSPTGAVRIRLGHSWAVSKGYETPHCIFS